MCALIRVAIMRSLTVCRLQQVNCEDAVSKGVA
jgi:hypothetical protein